MGLVPQGRIASMHFVEEEPIPLFGREGVYARVSTRRQAR